MCSHHFTVILWALSYHGALHATDNLLPNVYVSNLNHHSANNGHGSMMEDGLFFQSYCLSWELMFE